MKKIRIGNDILMRWEITTADGEPYRLTDKSLQLLLSTTYDRKEVSKFEVEDNILMFTYMGKNQRQLGRYTVTLIENNGKEGMHTVDACDAFELVARSCEVGGDDDGNIEAITLDLKSVITVGGGGPVDDELDRDSKNAISNRAVTRALEDKQDTIEDLEAIRGGAKKGATAIQKVKTINNQSIEGEGNITIEGGGGNIDPELLEGFIPLSRDFSDDFNNDFAR